jgi:hypothetical protein
MSTTLDRALTLTRRGLAPPSRRSLAVRRALLACGIGSSAPMSPPTWSGRCEGAATARSTNPSAS